MSCDEVINNTNASVSSIIFLDDDLDNDELGGNITWLPPEDMTQDGMLKLIGHVRK